MFDQLFERHHVVACHFAGRASIIVSIAGATGQVKDQQQCRSRHLKVRRRNAPPLLISSVAERWLLTSTLALTRCPYRMHSMASPFLDLLTQIASGFSIFEPFHRTRGEIVEFQNTVERLLAMKRQGLISYVFTQKREIDSQEYVDMVTRRADRGRCESAGRAAKPV